MSIFFSVIIPLYNRPGEIKELLESLTKQTYHNFEVLVIEDGSEKDAREIVESFKSKLQVFYFYKPNSGPGPSRNYGCARAKGDYFVIFDSDCIIPPDYLQVVNNVLIAEKLDFYGGPDRSHPDFSAMQKAVSYAMTSLLTTGGIRGQKKHMNVFHPRSFNLGMSKLTFAETGGFSAMRYGEDIEFSIRAIKMGFKSGLIPEAFVYHKRRTNLRKFFIQVWHSGRARIHLFQLYPDQLKIVHWFPFLFTLGFISIPVLFAFGSYPGIFVAFFYGLYTILLLIDASIRNKSISVGLYSIAASYIQMFGYGSGFLKEGFEMVFQSKDKRLFF